MSDTHRSATDPESRLCRKSSGVGAFLSHAMHALMENRNGLVLAVAVSEANGRSERECALGLVRSVRKRHKFAETTLAADMGYDSSDFPAALERESARGGTVRAEDEGGDARCRAHARQSSGIVRKRDCSRLQHGILSYTVL